MKENIPPAKSGNDKHGLSDMRIGTFKDFKVALYSTIRLAACYRSKKLNRRYTTRKMPNESGKIVVRVFCNKA